MNRINRQFRVRSKGNWNIVIAFVLLFIAGQVGAQPKEWTFDMSTSIKIKSPIYLLGE